MIDWLEHAKVDFHPEGLFYSLKILKKSFPNMKALTGGYLVIDHPVEHDHILRFALFQWHSLDEEENVSVDLIFHGLGIPGLRECRHTHWGERGYLYYPPGCLIREAFTHLSTYFDGM